MYSALLTAIVLWISGGFGIPANYEHPSIKLVPAQEVTFLRYRAFTAAQQRDILRQHDSLPAADRREAVAVYDDKNETIYLPDTWKGDTAADLSVLVHEMVHHLQNKNQIKYECAGAREELAYAAQ